MGQVCTPDGISELIHSTIGVKQGCPLSPTLFGIYVDEVSDYIERGGDRGSQLAGTWISLLLYADDIVLISDSPEGMQRHLDALHTFASDSGLSVNLGKTKVMVFNTTPHHSGSGDLHRPLHMVRRRWSIQMHTLTLEWSLVAQCFL